MSISQNFPNLKPSLLLDFQNTKALDSRVTFARASSATYYGTETAKAEENLLLRSQEFDVTWGVSRGAITANSTTAPDGTTTAETFSQSSGETTSAEILQTVTSVVAEYVYSVFAEADTKSKIYLTEGLVTSGLRNTWFDLSAGTVGTTNASHTAAIEDVGGGWYRCQIKFTAAARIASLRVGLADTDNSTTVTDSGGVFLWGAQLEQRSAVTAYTPTTTQPITRYQPVLESVASNVARFDHDPITGESLGLLVEEQRTNLVLYSEDFADAGWVKANATITANTIVAPDGTLTGDNIVEGTTASSTAQIYRTVGTSAVAYTWSVYAKAAERNFLVLNVFNASSTRVYFNLSTGVVGTVAAGVTASITAVGNGWYRCSLTRTTTADVTTQFQVGVTTSDNTPAYTGDGYSGIYIWGAQLEAGVFPTSYVKTVASQVTRAADAASMTGANFSSWYRQDEGSIYVEASTFATDGAHYYFALTDGGNANGILAYRFSSSVFSDIFNNNVLQFRESIGAVPLATPIKLSSAYKFNNSAFSRDGSVSTTDTSCVIPVLNRLNFGVRGDALQTTSLDGHIRKLSYYPARLTNAQLQALTG